MDFKNMGSKKVMVVTDATVAKLDAMKQVQEGLEREGIPYEVFSKARVEPKDYSYVYYSLQNTGHTEYLIPCQNPGSNRFRKALRTRCLPRSRRR